MKKPSGYVIYEGASLLDGKPIMVVALLKSSNGKTGNMVQTYIMRSDIDPMLASKKGEDFSICGECPHRGEANDDPNSKQAKKRGCYVILFQGPLNVYKSYTKGNYPTSFGHDAIQSIGDGKDVRLGTYGDPSVVPRYVWDSLLGKAKSNTAYSHQASQSSAQFVAQYMMRSADTLDEARKSWAMGERTFRVAPLTSMVKGKEILCPASEEAGRRTTCEKCGLCGGMQVKAKSILIPPHGNGRKYVA